MSVRSGARAARPGLRDLIYEDKDKTFGFEVQKKKKKKSAFFSKVSEIVNDLLLPPAMRPQWEKEQAALKREKEEEARLKKLKAERDWKRAGGLKDDVEEEQTAAGRLAAMRKALGEGSGHRMEFERAPINGPRTNGRFGTVPQRNVDYFREENFRYDLGSEFVEVVTPFCHQNSAVMAQEGAESVGAGGARRGHGYNE